MAHEIVKYPVPEIEHPMTPAFGGDAGRNRQLLYNRTSGVFSGYFAGVKPVVTY